MTNRALVSLAILLSATCVLAQEYPRAEIFGGYSYLNADTQGLSDRLNVHGWGASATANVNRWFGITGDFAGHYKDCGLSCREYSFLFGPKFSFRNANSRAVPFLYGLVGADNAGVGLLGVTVSENSLAFAGGGGLDYAIGRHFAIRFAQADYLYTRHAQFAGGTHQNNFRVAAGIVFTFGGSSTNYPGHQQSPHLPHSQGPTEAPEVQEAVGPVEFPALGLTAIHERADGGAEITNVVPNGPAARAGLAVHDVIVGINGSEITHPAQLQAILAKIGNGRPVEIHYRFRGTARMTVTVTPQ